MPRNKVIPLKKGDRFSRFVLSHDVRMGRYVYWLCRCDCGTEKLVRRDHLRTGGSQSCGCLHKELTKARANAGVLHKFMDGHSKRRSFSIWLGMKQRCLNPKATSFVRYGGRGVKLCDRWLDYRNFVSDMGEPLPGASIDRIDNDGHYEPSNCRWATRSQQMGNQSVTRTFERDGVTYVAKDLASQHGFKTDSITARAAKGLSLSEIVSAGKKNDCSGLLLGSVARRSISFAKTHCNNGHAFTPENSYINPKGARFCRRCHADKELKRLAAKRLAALTY